MEWVFQCSVVINGKHRRFYKRKYCTSCSPFGAHNTVKLHVQKRPPFDLTCTKCGKQYRYDRKNRHGHTLRLCNSCYMSRYVPAKSSPLFKEWRKGQTARSRKWKQTNRDRLLECAKKLRLQHVHQVVEHFGGKCSCCGEDNWCFMTISHPNNDGKKQRETLRIGSSKMYDWLVSHHFQSDFEITLECYNCNNGRLRNNGLCPHKHSPPRMSKQIVWYRYLKPVLDHYGDSCLCCGETVIQFLTISHLNNDGNIQRKRFGIKAGAQTYQWLTRNRFPANLKVQIECYNCNLGRRRNHGSCPHK